MTSKKSYTEDFKQGVVDLVLIEGMSCVEASRRMGISPKNVSRWVQERSTSKKTLVCHDAGVEKLSNRIKELEKENIRLKKEREILKKAAAFFASQSE